MSMELERARDVLRNRGPQPAAEALYARWYHAQVQTQRNYPDARAYDAATLTAAQFEGGWIVRSFRGGAAAAVSAERGGRLVDVAPPRCAPAEPWRLQLQVGDALLVAPLLSGRSGGFWHLMTLRWLEEQATQRLYLVVMPGSELEAARRWVGLAPTDEPWALKLLEGRHHGGRRDPMVVYLTRGTALEEGWVSAALSALGDLVEGEPPPGTLRLAAGIGWAANPAGGESFGQQLCRLLARAAERPGVLGSSAAWREAVEGELATAGLDPERPHLGARTEPSLGMS
jgi:hypothetical protein